MRHHPSCWNKVLAKLGFRRVPRHQRQAAFGGRLSRMEALEARQMMTVTVDTLADVVDAFDGRISLREAITAAPSNGNAVDFHDSLTHGVITLNSQLTLTQPITINGLGADTLTVAAGGTHRVFEVLTGVTATLSGMKITGGNLVSSLEEGAGIFNSGTLTLNSVEVSGNTSAGAGGGISSRNYSGSGSNSLYINDSTISDNHAVNGSGVSAYMGGGVLAIRRSTIANNVSQVPLDQWSSGAGIQLVGAATSPLIENSTISGNVSQYIGGIRLWAVTTPLNVINSTIAFNRGLGGAGIDVAGGSVAPLVHNSIFAQNTNNALLPAHLDVGGGLNPNSSYNLFGAGVGATSLTGDGNKSGTSANPLDPKLSPLDNLGGSTKTHALLPGSPAIDAGGPTSGSTPATDQRGYRRVSARPETNATSDLDMGAVELSQEILTGWLVTADFNGDRRNDQLLFDPVTREITGVTGAPVPGGFELGVWGSLWSDAAITTGATPTFTPGDFNGDGRDDVLIRTSAAFHVGISDGASFVFHTFQSLPGAWYDIFAGDVSGDGRDELVAWNGTLGGWQVAYFTEQTGRFSVDASWGSVNLFHEAGARHYFADANGDGREDLIRRTTAGAWGVALSLGTQFVLQNGWSTTWFNGFYDESTNKLTADGPIKKVLRTFENIYNNVELELYPGLMKGPEATRQTKAGNNWDQAALLEEELQALGLGEVKIASGRVRANVDRLREWLGLKSNVTNAALLTVMKSTLDYAAIQFDSSTIEFTHAWVQAFLPTPAGMAWINFDPSWKFKDRQVGVQVPNELDNVHVPQATGMFDEFSYLGLNSTTDRRLPLEFFEDQVMDWLAKTPAVQGNSLADVPYDGPIKAKHLQSLPFGPADGLAFPEQPQVAQYEHFAAIATTPALSAELTHRVTIRLKKNNETAVHWTHDLVVPSHSLDTIQVTFGGSSGTASDPNSIASAGPFFSRLVIDGSAVKWADATESFSAADVVKIELVHLAPTKLTRVPAIGDPDYIAPTSPNYTGPSIYDRIVPFSETPGNILAFGFDANQYSRDSLTKLQADVLAAVAGDTMQADLIKDVDLLSSYAIAKYWHDYEEQNRTIAGITGAIGYQQWVGSGRISAKPSLLLDPKGDAGDYVIDYLAFGMAPANFGIDLPNSNNGVFEAASGDFHSEAWQLMGYNSSALEHNVVEEITSAESVSTIKGLQRAYRKNLGLNSSGNSVSDDVIHVFESRVSGSTRTVYHVYNVRSAGTDVQVIGTAGVGTALTQNSFEDLLESHDSATGVDNQLWTLLSGANGKITLDDGEVTALATKHRTDVDAWTGAVYLVDVPEKSMQFAIQPDGGSPANGGYSGGVTQAPPLELPLGTFANASWAGDPVHVANGNMFRDETDIVFPNIGVPLTFSRHYDSQSKDDVGMGVGWTYSFSDMLYLDEKGTIGSTGDDEVVWIAASGARHRFKKLSNGTYVTPVELKGTLVRQATTEFVAAGGFKYVYLDPSGMEYHFQEINDVHPQNGFDGPHTSIGRLRLQKDEQGNGVRIDYIYPTQFHGFTEIRDLHDVARKLVFTYETGRVTTVVKYDPLDNPTNNPSYVPPKWTYGYTDVNGVADSEKRLASAMSPAVPAVNASYQELTSSTTVTYDYYNAAAGDPPYAKGLIKKIIERDGSWHTYEYYRNGRTFRVKQGEAGQSANAADAQTFNYNLLRNLTEFADERGNVETYIHQTNGLLTKQIHSDRSHTKTTWGAANQWNEYLMTSTTDERGAVEDFTYFNTSGVVGSEFKHKQLEESTAKHYPNQTGLVTRFNYLRPNAAAKPYLVAVSTITVDPQSGIPDSSNGYYVGQLLTTTNQYYSSGDAIGKLWKTTDARGNVVEYAYYDNSAAVHLRGQLRSIKQPVILDPNDPNGIATVAYETLFDYDAAGNVIKSTTQTAVTAPAVPVVISESTFVYDSLGNVMQKIVAANVVAERVVTESVYDALGRLRETGFADANAAIDPIDGFTSRFKYDKSGRVRESKDPLGRITRFEYDRQGNVVKQINPDGSLLTNEYDAIGNRVAATDSIGRAARYLYDNRNRLIQTIHPDGASERLRYDGAGNLVASTDALGNVTTFRYDAAGRLVETRLPDPNSPTGTANSTTTNKYDKLGNLVETIDPEFNVTQFQYDKLGRVVESRTIDGREFVSKNASQKLAIRNSGVLYVPTLGHNPVVLTTTDYDAVGNVKQTVAYDTTALSSIPTDPRTLITAQNIADNKVQVVAMRYDAFGRLVKTINADNTTTRTEYDAAGRVRYQYDELNRVTEFVYDVYGRLEKTKLPDPTTGTITTASPTTSYSYDAVGNRIATIDPRGFTTRFEYDPFNRLTATVDAQGNRTRTVYDVAGQVVATVDALGRATSTRYDSRGRVVQTRGADPDGVALGASPISRSEYDAAGRLTRSVSPLGDIVEYQYDNIGRLLKKSVITAQIVDDGDSGFVPFDAGDAFASSTSHKSFGGDSTVVTSTGGNGYAQAIWTFDNLPSGVYRIAATWTVPAIASFWVSPKVSTDGGAWVDPGAAGFGLNQQILPNDFVRFEEGVVRPWENISEAYVHGVPGDGQFRQLRLILTAGVGATLAADAVRIERIDSTSFQYDANDNLLKEIDPLGRGTTYAYDELDRIFTESLPDPDFASSGPLPSPKTTTNYDGYGNVKSVLEQRGGGVNQRTTKYAYDSRNRRTEEIFDAGEDGTNGVANYLNRKTTFDYDAVGNLEHRLESAENATTSGQFDLLRTTSYQYDKLDRRTRETSNTDSDDNVTTPVERVTMTAYDVNGNVSQTVENANTTAALITQFVYDSLNRVAVEIAVDWPITSSSMRITRFQYDAAGQQIAVIDPLLRVSRSEFDRLGRLVKSTGSRSRRPGSVGFARHDLRLRRRRPASPQKQRQ